MLIPDSGFVPLLAAYLSAAALVDPGLSASRRVELIQMLVPTTITNPTALDTVLARLLISACPNDKQVLDALTHALDTYIVEKPIKRSVTDREIGIGASQSINTITHDSVMLGSIAHAHVSVNLFPHVRGLIFDDISGRDITILRNEMVDAEITTGDSTGSSDASGSSGDKLCPNCKQALVSGAKFCSYCGTRVS